MVEIKPPRKFGSEFPLHKIAFSILAGLLLHYLDTTFLPIDHLPNKLLSAWQVSCGLALIFEQAAKYRSSSVAQAGRVAELAGLAWLLFGFLTAVATHERSDAAPSSLAGACVLWCSVAFNAAFSVAAGPCRLDEANSREPTLVALNTALVTWTAAAIWGRGEGG